MKRVLTVATLTLGLMTNIAFAKTIETGIDTYKTQDNWSFMRLTKQEILDLYLVQDQQDYLYLNIDTRNIYPIYSDIAGQYPITIQAVDKQGEFTTKQVTLDFAKATSETNPLELANETYGADDLATTSLVFSQLSKFCKVFGLSDCENYTELKADNSALATVYAAINNQETDRVIKVDVTAKDALGTEFLTTITVVIL